MNYLLKHQWLQFRRSGSFGRELGLSIFIALIAIFLLFMVFFLSFQLPRIIPKLEFEGAAENPIKFFNGLLIYYFFMELFMRYFLQKVPVLDIQPYLNLPIKRSFIARFLLGKSLLNLINILSLLLVIPFAIRTVAPVSSGLYAFLWVAGIFLISLSLHFFNILFKKKLDDNLWVWVGIIIVFTANYFLATYGGINLLGYVGLAFDAFISQPITVAVPLVLFLVLAVSSYRMYVSNLYLEELSAKETVNTETYSDKLSFLGNYGLSGQLILEEFRMIIRHKRTRSVLMLSLVFLAYGLIFLPNPDYDDLKGFHVFLGIFISGIFAINYGQFLWSWNTNQLDFFFTRPLALTTWIKSRYILILFATLVSTVLSIPYVYFGWEVLLAFLTCSIYNIGVNIPVMMRLSMWGPKPIDLNKGAFMNYQGTGAAQWVMGIPVLLGPFIIYTPLYYTLGHIAGLIGIGIIGLISLSLRDYFIKQIEKKFRKSKYQLIHELTV